MTAINPSNPTDNPSGPTWRKSLAVQLTWTSMTMVALAAIVLGMGLIHLAARSQRNTAFQLQQRTAQQVAQLISGYMLRSVDRLAFSLKSMPSHPQAIDRQKEMLENLLVGSLPRYSLVSLVDRSGREQIKISRFHTYLPQELVSQAQSPAFAAAMRGETYIGPVAFLGDTGLLSVRLALPVRASLSDITGALIAEVNMTHLWLDVARIRIGETGYAYLTDRNGHFVAYQKVAQVIQRYGEDVSRMPPVAEFVARGIDGIGQVREYPGLFGEKVIGVCASIQGTGWAAIVEQPVREAYAGISEMRRYLFWLLTAGIFFSGWMGYSVSRRLVRPIRTLTEAARRFGAGELETEFVDLRRQDEVGVLSQAFNRMRQELTDLYAGLRRKVEELEAMRDALQQSEENYRIIVENQSDLVVKVDIEGRFLFVSPSYCAAFGKTEADLLGQNFMPLVHPEDREKTAREMEKLLHPPYSIYVEQRALTQRGWRWLGWQDNALRDDKGKITAIIGAGRDITDRVQAQAALKESEERFRALVEQSPLGISLIGPDGRYKYINPQFQSMFGYTMSDIPNGREWFRRAYPDEAYRQAVLTAWVADQETAENGRARPRTYAVTCKDGSRKQIHFRPVTLGNRDQFIIYEDISEKSRMEQQLQQAKKFEAIGTLAGGIAHDFNNLLMGIQGRCSLILLDLYPSHPHWEHLQAMEEHIKSAADLTRQLLGYARGGKYEVKPTDLNELVHTSATLFGRTRKEVRMHIRTLPSPLVADVDMRQIEQVLLNIYVNAWQAMPNGGEIDLETETVTLDDAFCRPYQTAPGRYGKISITDNGIGMDEATRLRIFDPFFTTKEKGRGTGLGLASAYGIIKNHAGMITVYSEVGRGATFNIYLPLSDKQPYREAPAASALFKGSEAILLVDDEALILEVASAMLETLGYRVVTAGGGEAAIAVLENPESRIDLVILDLIMPGMDGSRTFDRIREIRPAMPVMLSSGYAINGQADQIMRRGCNGFIQKPFNISDLSRKIRSILDSAKNDA